MSREGYGKSGKTSQERVLVPVFVVCFCHGLLDDSLIRPLDYDQHQAPTAGLGKNNSAQHDLSQRHAPREPPPLAIATGDEGRRLSPS